MPWVPARLPMHHPPLAHNLWHGSSSKGHAYLGHALLCREHRRLMLHAGQSSSHHSCAAAAAACRQEYLSEMVSHSCAAAEAACRQGSLFPCDTPQLPSGWHWMQVGCLCTTAPHSCNGKCQQSRASDTCMVANLSCPAAGAFSKVEQPVLQGCTPQLWHGRPQQCRAAHCKQVAHPSCSIPADISQQD